MRTSRLSRDTSKLFFASSSVSAAAMPAASAATAPPRRSTRVSALAARFRYREADDEDDEDDKEVVGAAGSRASSSSLSPPPLTDIEDVIPSPKRRSSQRETAARKRKRAVTVTDSLTAAIKAEAPEPASSSTSTTTAPPPPTKPLKPPKPSSLPSPTAAPPDPFLAPAGWEALYDAAKQMRLPPNGAAANAPVDTMGCERLADGAASPRDRRFQTLVALMLSSQTKDTVNAVVMARLRAELPPCREGAPAGLNLENVLAVEEAELNRMIWQVGFHNNKARYIKQAATILRDTYGGDIPPTVEGLMSLPGVGPKMAYLCASAPNGWDRVEGIGVDVHVHRIANLWGWTSPKGSSKNKGTKTPEETRLALQRWLPRDRWREINWLLVGLGQTVCLPVGRRCGDCDLGLRGLCPAAERAKVAEGLRRRGRTTTLETEEMEELVVKEEIKEKEIKEADGEEDAKMVVVTKTEKEKVKVEEVEEVKQVIKKEAVNKEVPEEKMDIVREAEEEAARARALSEVRALSGARQSKRPRRRAGR